MYIVLALQCQKTPKQLINCLKREKQTSFLLFLMVPSVKSVLILLLFVNMNLVPENLYLDQWLYRKIYPVNAIWPLKWTSWVCVWGLMVFNTTFNNISVISWPVLEPWISDKYSSYILLIKSLPFIYFCDKGLSWSWSYCSWIYYYQCNHCLSPPMLWVRILLWRGILDTTLCDTVCQWLAAGGGFLHGILKVALNILTLFLW
jgi:hypothetical protein